MSYKSSDYPELTIEDVQKLADMFEDMSVFGIHEPTDEELGKINASFTHLLEYMKGEKVAVQI